MMASFAAIGTAALAGTLLLAGRGRKWASYTLIGLYGAFIIEAILVGVAAASKASGLAQLCISCSLGLALAGLGLGVHWSSKNSDDSNGGDNGGGPGGGGPGPDFPPDPEPEWWPEFERKLFEYLNRTPQRQLERV